MTSLLFHKQILFIDLPTKSNLLDFAVNMYSDQAVAYIAWILLMQWIQS